MRIARILLVIIAVVCLGVALTYPIRYHQAQEKNDSDMEELARMRQQARQSQTGVLQGGQAALDKEMPEASVGGENLPEVESVPADNGAGKDSNGDAVDDLTDLAPGTSAEDGRASSGQTVFSEDKSEAAGDSMSRESRAKNDGSGEDTDAQSPRDGNGGEGLASTASSEAGRDSEAVPEEPAVPTPKPTPTPEPTLEPYYWDLSKYYAATATPVPTPGSRVEAGSTVEPTPTPDRSIRNGPLPYALKEKVTLDKAAILPELKEIYALNNDLVGWINIPDTVIDYPVVQAEDGEYYLTHDFYGEENINGQIILDALCDPYTPSYNLIVSGHHMKNGTMFGGLPQYRSKNYWESHRFLEFDTLMERKLYVIFACFYSADYDEDERGFRYNAIIDYKIDAVQWLEEIVENQLYDTGIEREFGDEFITLTTCDRARHRNGRFVVVGRKIREGETFE